MNKREKREERRTNAKEWAAKQGKGFDNPSIKLPEGVEWYKLEAGVHKVDFLNYRVGKGNPAADEGYEHFERQYMCHRVPTPDGKNMPYVCLWDAFKKPCPICAWITRHPGEAYKKVCDAMKGRVRHLWIINDRPGKTDNPLKILDTNDWNKGMGFRELMQDAINSVENGEDFSDLQNGLTVQLTIKEQPPFPGASKAYNAVTRIDFLARKHEGYPEDMLRKIPCLDDLLQEFNADAVARLLDQGTDEDGPDPDEPVSPPKSSSKAKVDDDDDDQPPARATKQPMDDDDDDGAKAKVDKDDDDPKPSKAKKVLDDDDDDDDAAKPLVGKGKSPKEFPVAKQFGLKEGMFVMYEGEQCEIKKISGDGTSLTLETDDEETYTGVGPEEVVKVKVKDAAKNDDGDDDEPKPSKAKKVLDDDDDDDDEPVKKKKKVLRK